MSADSVARVLLLDRADDGHGETGIGQLGRLLRDAGYRIDVVGGHGPRGRELDLILPVARHLPGADALVVGAGGGPSWWPPATVLRLARRLRVPSLVVVDDDASPTDDAQLVGLLRLAARGVASGAVARRLDELGPGYVVSPLDASRAASVPTWAALLDDVGARRDPHPVDGCASLAIRDVPDVATVHGAAFPHSAVTQLGPGVVRSYYRWQFVGPHPAPFAAGAWRAGRLVGFVFGGMRWKAVAGFARQGVGTIAVGALGHPRALRQLALPQVANVARLMVRTPPRAVVPTAAVPEGGPTPAAEPSFGILSIAVTPDLRGTGVAGELMDLATARAVADGYHQMHLTVDVANPRAIAFYEKRGWQRRMPPAGAWAGAMVRPLSAP